MYWSMDRLFSRCIMNVFCMYLELASTACMRCGDTWIMCGSHNTRPTCGIRPKYILIHDQIHVSVRGVSSPNSGGIMTMPPPYHCCGPAFRLHPLRWTDTILCRFFGAPTMECQAELCHTKYDTSLFNRQGFCVLLKVCPLISQCHSSFVKVCFSAKLNYEH